MPSFFMKSARSGSENTCIITSFILAITSSGTSLLVTIRIGSKHFRLS
ncbi:hypothetical protein EVA_20025 [gut metagenome]|uniref:Uncharacterized protein n=1 Tax=gut metagenome TaxID=749906 RepID=J9FWX5_9ZZZZ